MHHWNVSALYSYCELTWINAQPTQCTVMNAGKNRWGYMKNGDHQGQVTGCNRSTSPQWLLDKFGSSIFKLPSPAQFCYDFRCQVNTIIISTRTCQTYPKTAHKCGKEMVNVLNVVDSFMIDGHSGSGMTDTLQRLCRTKPPATRFPSTCLGPSSKRYH